MQSTSKTIMGVLGIGVVIALIILGVRQSNQPTDSYSDNSLVNNQPVTTQNITTPEPSLSTNPASPEAQKKTMQTATLATNFGTIVINLNTESAPNTTANFIKLAQSGFYNGVRFHRVINDFMIQTGDPQSKDLSKKSVWGTGGPGYQFADELTGKETYQQGTVAMANAGPNTNGSQFFIVTAHPGYPLPPNYTVFGTVEKGLDVALKIQEVTTETNDRPVDDVIIEKITVE
jgi:cyclophilin family peptidyl-prolyl cis-trans isomerase